MQDNNDAKKALIDIRNMINGVGEQTTQALEKIQKAIEALVSDATQKHSHYQRAYLKHGLQEVMLSGNVSPAITKPLLPVLKSAIKKLDGTLDATYQAQAKAAKVAKPAKPKPDPKNSTTHRIKRV